LELFRSSEVNPDAGGLFPMPQAEERPAAQVGEDLIGLGHEDLDRQVLSGQRATEVPGACRTEASGEPDATPGGVIKDNDCLVIRVSAGVDLLPCAADVTLLLLPGLIGEVSTSSARSAETCRKRRL